MSSCYCEKKALNRLQVSPDTARQGREALWRKRLRFEEAFGLRLDQPPYHLKMGHVWRSRIISAGLRLSGIYGWGVRNALRPKMREETFCFSGLPESLRGFRILHLSDPHFVRNDGRLADAAAQCVRGIEVDLCVLTGDYCWGHFGSQDFVREPLGRLLEGVRSRYGFWGILGNHDTHEAVEVLRSLDAEVLINEGRAIEHRGAQLWLGGTDDPHKFLCASVPLAMQGAPDTAFRILLSHTPECAETALEHGVQLYLCGHTHGGQVRLPFGPPLHLNIRCNYAWGDGRWRHESLQGFTTRGIGTTDVPVRYFCPPETTVITLETA